MFENQGNEQHFRAIVSGCLLSGSLTCTEKTLENPKKSAFTWALVFDLFAGT